MTKTEERIKKHHQYRKAAGESRRFAPYLTVMEDEEQLRLLDYRRAAVLRQMCRVTTERERECMKLYYVQRMTQEEIGFLMGRAVSTVSRNISRGKQKVLAVLRNARVLMGEDFM